jgi:hypothetical protein
MCLVATPSLCSPHGLLRDLRGRAAPPPKLIDPAQKRSVSSRTRKEERSRLAVGSSPCYAVARHDVYASEPQRR